MADESIKPSKKLFSTLFGCENGNVRKVRRYNQSSLARQTVVKMMSHLQRFLETVI